jgi:hypothetical protein
MAVMGQVAPVHSKILNDAARRILRPMGLTQKGRSRTWMDDHGWWICIVEFQPSGWSKGSYLNAGCSWLWHVRDYASFDEGYRVETFVEFQDEEQFASAADRLARRAAEERSDLSPLRGWGCGLVDRSHGWRRGLRSVAAPRLVLEAMDDSAACGVG